ncbi:hypothetical protein LCGC14_2321640 [marine sediment metagenome]|uniref:Uncharacterized protein n=1 Tax=marine sediment metagenome TaxID=412755 RepID=A0A0F9EV43_9ZZZZ
MVDIRIDASVVPGRATSDKQIMAARGTRDGSLYTADWLQALSMEGRVYGVAFGDANLGIVTVGTFGAGAIDLDEFDLLHTIPATVVCIPIYFKVAFSAIGTILSSGAALVYGSGGVISNGISATPANMRPGSNNTSASTVTGLGDDGGTAMTVGGVFFREASTALTGVAGTPAQLGYEWTVATAGYIPVLEGLASPNRQVAGFAHGQAGTGWITYVFAELPISAIE